MGKKKRRVNQSFGGVGEDPGQVTVLSDSAGKKKMRCWHSNLRASATCGEKTKKSNSRSDTSSRRGSGASGFHMTMLALFRSYMALLLLFPGLGHD